MKTNTLTIIGGILLLAAVGEPTPPPQDKTSEATPLPLQAEKPDSSETVEVEVLPEIPVLPPMKPDPAQELYQRAVDYQTSGGRQWVYRVGNTMASRDQLIEHLAAEHEVDADVLRRFNQATLLWIHGMLHEEEKQIQSGKQQQSYTYKRVKICGQNGCRWEWRRVPR